MLYIARWKVWGTVGVCLLGIWLSLPTFFSEATLSQMPSWFPRQRLSLGLDLQGGSHLLLGVDLKAVAQERMTNMVDALRQSLRKAQVGYTGLTTLQTPQGPAITLNLRDTSHLETLKRVVKEVDVDLTVASTDQTITITYPQTVWQARNRSVVDQSIEIVRRRIDETGTREPTIQRHGEDAILVQLPGIQDPQRVKDLLGRTAKLTLRLIDPTVGYDMSLTAHSIPPVGAEILPGDDTSANNSQPVYFAVKKTAAVSGDMLIDAQPAFDEYNRATVVFKLDSIGAKRFADVTRENVGRPFAIVLDNKVICAPVIREPIPGGTSQISGNFTVQQAQDLALLLRAGALPAPLTILEERTVGPELGSDSIEAGSRSTMIAVILVAIFMLVAYSLFGVFANIAVVFNIIFLLASLCLLQATLTLPGIAGIALTVGMAVDANILIYERIREELRNGQKIAIAVDSGFTRAMATIIDSNLTTLIGALLMYQFGTGPIRGFAVSLALGIIISMFTAVSLTRVMVVSWLRWRKPKELSI
jgi:preprotein translocase subunit SecD